MAKLPTVKVVNDDGFAVINETDFDSKTMELYDETKKLSAVEKFALENDVSLDDVVGTGKGGAVTKKNLQEFLDQAE